ncbi:MAG: imelysin family protein [Nannocystaceae bacterium]
MVKHTASRTALGLTLALASCGGDDGGDDPMGYDEAIAAEVIETYAAIVHAGYTDTLAGAVDLDASIDAFLDAPSEAGLTAARDAWLAARAPYGQTEVFRFYGGPIDVEPGGPEGQINAWPMDEAYVDYVAEDPGAGIINDPDGFPDLTAQVLADANGATGEESVSTGYHAIEFLLWGQDLSDTGPGARPFTDYAQDSSATAENPERRGEYLGVVSELLVSDLTGLVDAWAPGGSNYRAEFTAMASKDALTKILLGMGSLSGAELSGERMTVAFDTMDQEDEHSCFSDNTHNDLLANELGIQNVYLGRYGDVAGKGLTDLVAPLDPALDQELRDRLDAAVAALQAIEPPFDRAIVERRPQVEAAIAALRDQTETIVKVATLLGITLNLEE